VTWRREITRASGFGISGFSVTRNSRQEKSRNPETRRSHIHSILVEDRCRRVNPRWSQRQVASEIGESEFQGREFHTFQFREVRNSDRGRTVVLWNSRSHAKKVSRRELRGAESTIADRESGIREVSDTRPHKCRFPDRENSR
jgi:hypothetical protein